MRKVGLRVFRLSMCLKLSAILFSEISLLFARVRARIDCRSGIRLKPFLLSRSLSFHFHVLASRFWSEEAGGVPTILLRVAKKVKYIAASPDRSAVRLAGSAPKQVELPPSSIFVERLFKAVLESKFGARGSVLE